MNKKIQKCRKKGHKIIREKIKVIMKSYEIREAAKKCFGEIIYCKRCKLKTNIFNIEKYAYITSLTMPDEEWEKLEKIGYVLIT